MSTDQDDATASVYPRLLDDIIHGRLVSGTLLPEPVLSRRYETSRTPVREALIRLEQDRLVERASRGYRVRSGSASEILDLYETRIALESLAARGAAIRHTQLELARLQLLHEQALGAQSEQDAQDLHSRWHRALWSAAHNRTVTDVLNRISHELRVMDAGNQRSGTDHSVSNAEHGAALEAIGRNDPDAAEAAISAHLTRTREARVRAFAMLDL